MVVSTSWEGSGSFEGNLPDLSENVNLDLAIFPSSVDHPNILGGISTCANDSKTIEVGSVTLEAALPIDGKQGPWNLFRKVVRLNASVTEEYYHDEDTGRTMVLNEEQAMHALDYAGVYVQVDPESVLVSNTLSVEGASNIDFNRPIFRRKPVGLSEMPVPAGSASVQEYVDKNSFTYVYFHLYQGW